MFTADNNKRGRHRLTDAPEGDGVQDLTRRHPDGPGSYVPRPGPSSAWPESSASDKIMVDGWRPLDTTQTSMPPIGRIADVAWLDATELLVLGAADATTAYAPFRVVEDASQITPEGESENWDAVELAVLPRTQTAIIVGRDGQTWKDDGSQWLPFIDKIQHHRLSRLR